MPKLQSSRTLNFDMRRHYGLSVKTADAHRVHDVNLRPERSAKSFKYQLN